MKTCKDIHPKYIENFQAMSRDAAKASARAVRKDGQRGLAAAVYQMANRCGGAEGKRANAERICKAVRALGRRGAQLVACPEMCLQGYFTWVDGTEAEARDAGRSLADDADTSPEIRMIRKAAREAKMVVVFGFSEKAGRKVYNAIGVIDADGAWLGSHRKNPLFPWPYETGVFDEPPKTQRVSVFATKHAAIGVANCFDGSFPETVRGMRCGGAEVMVWCNAAVGSPVTGNHDRVPTASAYACANNMAVVLSNGAAENLSGTSCICAPGGAVLTVLPPDEEAFGTATLNLAAAADWDIYRTRLVLNPAAQSPRP